MSQNFFQIIRPVHVHLKTDKVDLKKRPPWKKFFFAFFSIDSSSRHEKRCQMLQRLFWLFQCSKNPQWFEPIFNLFNFVLTDSSKDVNTTTGSSYTNSNETTKNPDDSKYIVPHFGNTKICGIGWGNTTVFLSIFISKDFSSIYLQSFTDSNLACTKYLLQLRRSIQMK